MPPQSIDPTDRLDERDINQRLVAAGSRARVSVLDHCDSTNAVLAREPMGAQPNGTVVTTEVQANGRGRRGRAWIAPPGGSLALSMLWRFDRGAGALAGLPLAVGVAVVNALKRAGDCPVRLKWPNDVVCEGAKLGGILVETRIGSSGTGPVMAIIGVGLNLRLREVDHIALGTLGTPGDAVPRVSDLASILAPLPRRNELLANIVCELADTLAQFEAEGFKAFRAQWSALHAYGDTSVRILSANGAEFTAQVTGIADDGALIVKTVDGIRHLHAGEVSLRPAMEAGPALPPLDRNLCGANR